VYVAYCIWDSDFSVSEKRTNEKREKERERERKREKERERERERDNNSLLFSLSLSSSPPFPPNKAKKKPERSSVLPINKFYFRVYA